MSALVSTLIRGRGVLGRFTAVHLEPGQRSLPAVITALARLRAWLEDEGWTVTLDGTELVAERHSRLIYTSLSPVARATRGTLAVWSDGVGMHLRFRPDWIAGLLDMGVLALLYARLRGILPAGSRWADAAVAFIVLAVALPAAVPLVRGRFVVMLARAIWSSDADWQAILGRGPVWRAAWFIAGSAALTYWVLVPWALPFLGGFAVFAFRLAMSIRHSRAQAAIPLLLLAALAVVALIAISLLGSDNMFDISTFVKRKKRSTTHPTRWRD